MRNPNRIPVVLDKVREVWEHYPDWRLGQLVVNIGRFFGYEDPFYMEDDEILRLSYDDEGRNGQGDKPDCADSQEVH